MRKLSHINVLIREISSGRRIIHACLHCLNKSKLVQYPHAVTYVNDLAMRAMIKLALLFKDVATLLAIFFEDVVTWWILSWLHRRPTTLAS
jgi:hypothetical protein